MKNEIIIYQPDKFSNHINVRVEADTIWLTQIQIVNLFESSKANISEHIKNIYKTGELNKEATVRKFRTVQKEGGRNVTRELTHYNLDMIISIGYRVNSIRGTQFRIWANKILKDYLLKGYALNNRMNRIEDNVQKHNEQYPKIEIRKLTTAHDRFMIIDKKTVYHFGASLKDAGKKWFVFSKLEMDAEGILEKLNCN